SQRAELQEFPRNFRRQHHRPLPMAGGRGPYMKETGKGAVVMISSIAGTHGTGSSIAYVASKGGLNSMTKALARALGPEIRVNAVCPGFIETRWLLGGYGEDKYELAKKKLKNSTPLKAVCQPEDIADAALMFIEGSSMVTGELMIVDGGMQLGR